MSKTASFNACMRIGSSGGLLTPLQFLVILSCSVNSNLHNSLANFSLFTLPSDNNSSLSSCRIFAFKGIPLSSLVTCNRCHISVISWASDTGGGGAGAGSGAWAGAGAGAGAGAVAGANAKVGTGARCGAGALVNRLSSLAILCSCELICSCCLSNCCCNSETFRQLQFAQEE